MSKRKYQPSIFGELKNLVRFFFGAYKNVNFADQNLRVHRKVYKQFNDKLQNLEFVGKLMGYTPEIKYFPLYKKGGVFIDSSRVEYRLTKGENEGYFIEFVFNPHIKTLRRIQAVKMGDKSTRRVSRVKHHVTNVKDDLAPLDMVLENL